MQFATVVPHTVEFKKCLTKKIYHVFPFLIIFLSCVTYGTKFNVIFPFQASLCAHFFSKNCAFSDSSTWNYCINENKYQFEISDKKFSKVTLCFLGWNIANSPPPGKPARGILGQFRKTRRKNKNFTRPLYIRQKRYYGSVFYNDWCLE